jgi:hypothetical protein
LYFRPEPQGQGRPISAPSRKGAGISRWRDPTGLNLTQDQTDVDLTWTDNAKTETGYAVERSTDGGSSWSALATALASNTVAYSDTTSSPGGTYHYRVRAANTFGASGWLTGNITLAVVPLDPWDAFIYSDDGVFQTKKASYPASSVTGYLSGLDSMGYDSQNTWVNIDSDVTVSSASDDFTGGYVEIAVGSATAGDDLRLVGNGGSLTVIDAAVYWDGSRVGTIDNTKDGQDGSTLRIDFSTVAPPGERRFRNRRPYRLDRGQHQGPDAGTELGGRACVSGRNP